MDRGPFWFNSRDFRRGVTHSSRFSVNFGFYSRSFLPPFEHFLRDNWTRIELEIDSKLATVSNPNNIRGYRFLAGFLITDSSLSSTVSPICV